MASRVVMPKLTDTMEEGTLLRWYKQEGDLVESGDAIAEIETDKAVMDLEAYASGVLRKVLVPPQARVPAGGLIAVIGRPDEDIAPLLEAEGRAVTEKEAPPVPAWVPQAGETAAKAAPEVKRPERAAAPPTRVEPKVSNKKVKASPLARKIAEESGVDLATVQGTGPEGRITREDVERAAGRGRARPEVPIAPVPPPPAAVPAAGETLSPMRRAIARKMVQSKAPVPHFYVTAEIGMDRALDLREQLKEVWGTDVPSITGLILKACAIALGNVPAVNASFYAGAPGVHIPAPAEERIILHKEIHLGIAVGLKEGLIVPVLRDCHAKGLRQIGVESADLIARARTRKVRPEEYAGATFSVSNLGMFEVDNFIAVITPPEAAVLAVGGIVERPVIREGRVVPARTMRVTLSCDHRAIDGVQAATFLQELRTALEQPVRLLEQV